MRIYEEFKKRPELLLQKSRRLRRVMIERGALNEIRIALLGGSTISEFKDYLELFLLDTGFRPSFYESGYGAYYEEALFNQRDLSEFKPDIAIVYTSTANLRAIPSICDDVGALAAGIATEAGKLVAIWAALQNKLGCHVIQTNFEFFPYLSLGSLDTSHPAGLNRFIQQLNLRIADEAVSHAGVTILDQHYLSSRHGLDNWLDQARWCQYKIVCTPAGNMHSAYACAAQILSIRGGAAKVLALDLDNTLWGGVIGDDGVDGIKLGPGNPLGEAFQSFQRYVLRLKDRGVILAVCSKNERANALAGLNHSYSLLKPDDFAYIAADWAPKYENLAKIAEALNIGLDSIVFVDDNPAEQHAVRLNLPQVRVPAVGSNVADYIGIIDSFHFFETVSLTSEDIHRGASYRAMAHATERASNIENYDQYLASLEMCAEIGPFDASTIGRVVQLANKTNQFNLTTHRVTEPEILSIAADAAWLTLTGRLFDRFADHGLVAVLAAKIDGPVADIELWLMSCRVFNRKLEHAMFDRLVDVASIRGLKSIRGRYIPSEKNQVVQTLYRDFGFDLVDQSDSGSSTWIYHLPAEYEPKNDMISVRAGAERYESSTLDTGTAGVPILV
jgi:FkbH-like protein